MELSDKKKRNKEVEKERKYLEERRHAVSQLIRTEDLN
jgi:hypothetical protein